MSKTIYRERESKLLEFKSKVPKFETLIKTCIAFANAAGGKVIIGVDDTSHEVIGINDHDRAKIYDDFPNSLYDSTSPSLTAQIYEQNFGDESALIIEIPACSRKPYFLKSKGINNGTYIRVGTSTRKATPEYIEDLIRESRRINYDEDFIYQNIDILSRELLHDYLQTRITTKRLLAEKIITNKSANKDTYAPTVAGTLMFAELPHDYIPEALVRCTQFRGTEGRDIIQTEDISGTIDRQASNSLELVKKWLTTHFSLEGAKLKGQLPIPEVALREAILNALLHRKYNIPGATKIALYDDRLEIFSPGCFPGLVDLNTLGDGMTFQRNPLLAKFAYRLHLIESRGTGIKLIYESCKKFGIKKPIYHEEGDFVKIIFYFEPDPYTFKNYYDAILAFINLECEVTAQDVANYLSVSRNTAIRKLGDLLKSKRIKKIGKGPSIKYIKK